MKYFAIILCSVLLMPWSGVTSVLAQEETLANSEGLDVETSAAAESVTDEETEPLSSTDSGSFNLFVLPPPPETPKPPTPPDPLSQLKDFGGKADVSLFTGSASFSYPLQLPPGRLGMEPRLSLNYSSNERRFDGLAGFGWNLPMSSIYRTSDRGTDQLYALDQFTAELNGSAEPLVRIDGATGLYGAETETNFTKFERTANGWIATDTSGKVYTFGTGAAAQQADPSDPSRVFKWLLERAEDPNGNYMTYTYTQNGGQVYPATIRYTGHTDVDNGLYEIRFALEDRSGPYTEYRRGFPVITAKHLASVELYRLDTNELIYQYDLGYTPRSAAVQRLTGKITPAVIDPPSEDPEPDPTEPADPVVDPVPETPVGCDALEGKAKRQCEQAERKEAKATEKADKKASRELEKAAKARAKCLAKEKPKQQERCLAKLGLSLEGTATVTFNYSPNGDWTLHHPDHLSSSSVDTDDTGQVVQLYGYYPFGDVRINSHATGYENDYQFTGKERDRDTNLLYYEARYYDSANAHFISLDPWDGDLTDPQTLNKTSYVRNNPVKYVDPTGESLNSSTKCNIPLTRCDNGWLSRPRGMLPWESTVI